MTIKLIKGCIGCGTCVKTCPTDVIRQDAKTKKAIIVWCLMLTLGITSLARKKLPMKYMTWRVFHGILAILFVSVAAWHVIDLGRHSSLVMSTFISVLTAGGVLFLLKISGF